MCWYGNIPWKICSKHRERVHTRMSVQAFLALSMVNGICPQHGSRCHTQGVAILQFQLVDLLLHSVHNLEGQNNQTAHLCRSVHISNNTCWVAQAHKLERKSHHPLACSMHSYSWKMLRDHCWTSSHSLACAMHSHSWRVAFSLSCNAKPKCRPREIDWSSQCKQTAKQLLFDTIEPYANNLHIQEATADMKPQNRKTNLMLMRAGG